MSEMDMDLPAGIKLYWKISWKYITPFILLVLLGFSWYDFGHVGYAGVAYPFWVQILGYLITGESLHIVGLMKIFLFLGCTLIALPIAGGCEIIKRFPETTEVFSSLTKPTHQWGPNHYQTCDTTEEALSHSLP